MIHLFADIIVIGLLILTPFVMREINKIDEYFLFDEYECIPFEFIPVDNINDSAD